jgi:hypothetical protein
MLQDCRFEPLPIDDPRPSPVIGRHGGMAGVEPIRFRRNHDGRAGFELPAGGVQLPVLAHGQRVGRFVLTPTPGIGVSLEQRLVAVAIADQVAAAWPPADVNRPPSS